MKIGGVKINNRTLTISMVILLVIIGVWLIGYFTGIEEGKNRTLNDLRQKETANKVEDNNQNKSLPPLPELPSNLNKTKKSNQTTNLPPLPEPPTPPNFTD